MGKKTNANFMLYGEGSFLNKGCEAIINTTIKKIKKSCMGKIVLSTNDLKYDSKYYNDLIDKYINGYYKEQELTAEEKQKLEYYKNLPFNYENFEKVYTKDCINCIDEVDVCLSAGGDNYCYGEPNWIYTVNKEIKRRGKKNVLWCTSLFEEISSDEMIRDLKTYDVIIARETLTYNALEKFIEKDRLMLSVDTAFSLDKKVIDLPSIFDEGKSVIGINLSPLINKYTDKQNNILDSICTLIKYILNNTEDNICLIPHVYIENNNDLETLRGIKKIFENEKRIQLLDERIYDCEELKYVISKCKYLVAARTHASIAGYSSLVPTLVIGYSVKSKGIALDLFGNYKDFVIPVNELTSELILEKYKYIQKNEKKIINTLENKMKIYKEKADNQIDELMTKLDELENKYITDNCKCTGCMACYNICPQNAITKKVSNDGFVYPEIDESKCIGCNLCKKVCPSNKNYRNKNSERKCFVAFNKNEKDRINSSSGGIVSCLAKKILSEKGVVYGVDIVKDKAKNIRIASINELDKILGSKYVQSDIDDIYTKVRDDLKTEKKVLFTGTPCQIEGLISFLDKDYKNLYTISIICHGVPSPGVFERYINEKERKLNSNIEKVVFRDKTSGWHQYSMKYNYDNKKSDLVKFTDDYYMKGFLKNYFLRESCYNCQMRINIKNSADMILGDYWGIENIFPEFDDNKGASAIIINTDRGNFLFDSIKEDVVYKESVYEDILKSNPVLESSVKYDKDRSEFFELIRNNTVENAIKILQFSENEEKIRNLEKDIEILNGQIKDLLDAKKYFLGQIELRDIEIGKKNDKIDEMDKIIIEKKEELQQIYNSKRWNFINNLANKIK